jgi:hypothetical protein
VNITGVIAFGVGAVLIYCAVKDKDPRAVVKEALGGKKAPTVSAIPPPNVPATPGDRTKNLVSDGLGGWKTTGN